MTEQMKKTDIFLTNANQQIIERVETKMTEVLKEMETKLDNKLDLMLQQLAKNAGDGDNTQKRAPVLASSPERTHRNKKTRTNNDNVDANVVAQETSENTTATRQAKLQVTQQQQQQLSQQQLLTQQQHQPATTATTTTTEEKVGKGAG